MKWTQEEESIIKNNFGKLTLNQIRVLLPYDRKYNNLRSFCHRLGLYRDRQKNPLPTKNTYNQEYFKDLNLNTCYVAGAISADGCIMKIDNNYVFKYGVAKKDECIINMLIKEFNFKGKKVYSKYNSESKEFEIFYEKVEISLNSFDKNAEYLKQIFNIMPNKTFRLGPTNLNNEILNFAFIIGNIDGDGTIAINESKKDNRYIPYLHFCGASPDILNWICDKIDRKFPAELYNYVGRTSKVLRQNNTNCFRYCIYGLRAAVIIDYLRQFPVPKLDRKWNKPEILDYINQKKLQHPDLFLTLDQSEIAPYIPNSQ